MSPDLIAIKQREIRTWQKILVEVRGLWQRREISIIQYWTSRDQILSELADARKEIAALEFESWRADLRTAIAGLGVRDEP